MSRLDRRDFLRLTASGVGGLVGGHLVSSCRPVLSPPAATSTAVPQTPTPAKTPSSLTPAAHAATGEARGIAPGRVVWVFNPDATRWDGVTGFWWQESNTDQAAVDAMFSASIRQLTGQSADVDAWAALFEHFNSARGSPGVGYRPGEKIAVKINLNASTSNAADHNRSFSSPHAIVALLRQLIQVARVPAADITIYDAVRHVPDCIYERCQTPELTGVHLADFVGGRGREVCQRDLDSLVHWSVDTAGNPTYLPTCVTQARYLINLAQLKGHTLCGVTLCAKNHCGTIMADLKDKPTLQSPQGANIHGHIAAHDFDMGQEWRWPQRPMGTYNALVDLMGHRHLGAKTLLFVIDGLYAAPEQSAEVNNAARWQSDPFDDGWTSSLFISQDGVAIDSVGLDFLRSEPTIMDNPKVMPPHSTCENFLHEAALAQNPASDTRYDPDGEGERLPSLGVHEHWNNPDQHLYSRNLGTGRGIELVQIA